MGWKTQANYEDSNERDRQRRPWRERSILSNIGWTAALLLIFVLMIGSRFR